MPDQPRPSCSQNQQWIPLPQRRPPFLHRPALRLALLFPHRRLLLPPLPQQAQQGSQKPLLSSRKQYRHRPGHRHTPLIQTGFYLPPEIDRAPHAALLAEQLALTRELLARGSPAYVYSLLLGAQTPFEHSTHADKFIYEAELRTGMGAHFRYAEHLSAVLREFLAQVPEARDWVVEGTAEPE